jgi:Tol biopolymer transport system component
MTRVLLVAAAAAALLAASASPAAAPVAHIGSIALDGTDARVLSGAEPAYAPLPGRDGRILFFGGGPEYFDLWVMNGDGTAPRRLVERATEGYGRVTWSPAGTSFATTGWDRSTCLPTSRNCAVSEIRLHDAATSEIRSRLRSTDRGAYMYSWSPDGRRIASLGALDMDLVAHTVEVANVDGTARRVLVRGTGLREIAWSPRGDRIAYVQRGWIWLVRPAGGKPERVTKGGRLLWSPRGQLLYSIDGMRRLLDPATKRSRPLVRAPASLVAWSPDGTRLAYRVSLAGGSSSLAVAHASDGRVLFRPKVSGKVTSIDFAAGGTRLLYGVTFD